MHCPACDDELSHLTVAGVELDICADGCGGIWFDLHEFRKFDEPHEYAGDELLDIESGMKDTTMDHKAPRTSLRRSGDAAAFLQTRKSKSMSVTPAAASGWTTVNSSASATSSVPMKHAAPTPAITCTRNSAGNWRNSFRKVRRKRRNLTVSPVCSAFFILPGTCLEM